MSFKLFKTLKDSVHTKKESLHANEIVNGYIKQYILVRKIKVNF